MRLLLLLLCISLALIVLTPPSRWNPSYVIFLETRMIGLHFAADSMGLSSFKIVSARITFRPFKVIHFGTNRKRVWNFLLVRHNNYGPIFQRFRDFAGFLLVTRPLFNSYFRSVPVGLDRLCWGQYEQVP